MKVLFACGGTAGHINPALAVADELCRRMPETSILFAGSPNGMESRLVPKAGYPFAPIEVAGIQRKLTPVNVARNAKALYLLAKSGKAAGRIISEFAPDIVMGTGGYVSGPVVRRAHKMGIKTLTHEQNAFPGVTTKLLIHDVDKVLLAVASAKDFLKDLDERKVLITGNPVRGAVLTADREVSRMRLGIGDKLCILSFGGSLGARRVNEAVAQLMAWHSKEGNIHHIHATGSYDCKDFFGMLADNGVTDAASNPLLDVREYIDNMPVCLAAADLVICRAGALTLAELQCAGRASILIPSPNVAENHQYHNAMELVRRGAAEIIEEKDLTGQLLCKRVQTLTSSPANLRVLGQHARLMAISDAHSRIVDEIVKLAY